MVSAQQPPTNVQEALNNIWARLKTLEANAGIGPEKHGMTLRGIEDAAT